MKKSNILPILAVVLGAVCFGLRRWQMAADFDALGLPLPGAVCPAMVMLSLMVSSFVRAMIPPTSKTMIRLDLLTASRREPVPESLRLVT